MNKKLGFTVLLSIFFLSFSFGQKTNVAIHISNPLGAFNKLGCKIELRSNRMGFLLTATRYFDIAIPHYPGTQLGTEWRYYSAKDTLSKKENFFYSKLIVGHQEDRARSGDGFTSTNIVPEGYYGGIGIGIGRRYNFKQFFLEVNGGLKGVFSSVKQELPFYLTGPGAFIDLHFNFGFQF